MSENRHAWVDSAKAIGIVLVVYGHVARGVHDAKIPLDEHTFATVDSVIYSFHMPLFFFLSGLFLFSSLQTRGKSNLLLNKLDTIIYPYILWSVIQGAIEVTLASHTNKNISIGDVLSFIWEPRAQFWFLYILFIFFVLSTITHTKNKLLTIIWIFIGFVIYSAQDSINLHFPVNYISKYYLFFLVGSLAVTKVDYIKRNISLHTLLSLTLFISTQYTFHVLLDRTYTERDVITLLTGFSSIYFITTLSMLISAKNLRLVNFIGRHSMTIYLTHIIAGSGARIFLSKVMEISDPSIHLAFGTTAAIVGPMIFAYIISSRNYYYVVRPPKPLSFEANFKKRK